MYTERLAALVSEYISHLGTDRWSALRGSPDTVDDFTARRLSNNPFGAGKPPVKAAVEWWDKNGAQTAGDARVTTLHCLLRELDRRLAPSELLISEQTSSGRLFIGRRWWERYRSFIAGTPGETVPGGDYTPPTPLRSIRLLEGRKPAWLRSPGFDDRAKRVLNDHGTLRLGMCVLGRKVRTRFHDTGLVEKAARARGFRASDVEWRGESGSVAGELADCVAWARRERVHVLCFPELSVDSAGRTALRNAVQADPGDLCLVVPGSFHEVVAGRSVGWVNKSPVWTLADDGEQLLEELGGFEKIEGFTMPARHADGAIEGFDRTAAEYREHIDRGGSLTLMPTPVGVFGIAICRDLLKGQVVERYALAVDHLLIVSMSDAETNVFWSGSIELARTGPTASYYVNSTQFVDPNKAVDLAYFWFPHGTLGTTANVAYFHQAPGKLRDPVRTEAIGPELRVAVEIPLPPGLVERQ